MLDTTLLLHIHYNFIKFFPNRPLPRIGPRSKRHMSFNEEAGVNEGFSGRFVLARFSPNMRRNWRGSDSPNVGYGPKPSPNSPAALDPVMTLAGLPMCRQIFAEATAEGVTQ
ncbi:hypothetical protein DL769_003199 [Monosporascus sp. CRB-8-3]|nr:hypothetical protein DL769_003199 [Monosporascus sp. CRB-8-3]